MSRYIIDLETDNLLDKVTKVHILCLLDIDTGVTHTFTSRTGLADGLQLASQAELLVGHNVIKYDIPVLRKLYPQWTTKARIFDTMIACGLIWSDRYEMDRRCINKGMYTMPTNVMGRNSLEAWGYRLGNHKGDYTGGWETLNDEMITYCEQDVSTTLTLYNKILSKNYSQTALDMEMQVATIIQRQESFGFGFDVPKAVKLLEKLTARRSQLTEELSQHCRPRYRKDGKTFVPKKDSKSGYVEGAPLSKIKLVEFNPASRDHIGEWLQKMYGWVPKEIGDNGKPTVDDVVLSKLKYPIAPILLEYLTVEKRIGQLSEGKQGWLQVERNGRIHGRVDTTAAVTGRMTHSAPNVAQVPACGAEYGKECRELFYPGKPGFVQVGADASGLELRMLAHYMARWDGGAYGVTVCDGKSSDGTDIHTVNQHAAGLPTRDAAKTFIYAFLKFRGVQQ